jgi:hypothetical protein
MRRFYIASGLENAENAKKLAEQLKAAGWKQTYDWAVHGSVQNKGMETIIQVACAEAYGVTFAQVVIVLFPGSRGTHTELGMALASYYNYKPSPVARKDIFICAEHEDDLIKDGRTCSLYHHPGVTDRIINSDLKLVAKSILSYYREAGEYHGETN